MAAVNTLTVSLLSSGLLCVYVFFFLEAFKDCFKMPAKSFLTSSCILGAQFSLVHFSCSQVFHRLLRCLLCVTYIKQSHSSPFKCGFQNSNKVNWGASQRSFLWGGSFGFWDCKQVQSCLRRVCRNIKGSRWVSISCIIAICITMSDTKIWVKSVSFKYRTDFKDWLLDILLYQLLIFTVHLKH